MEPHLLIVDTHPDLTLPLTDQRTPNIKTKVKLRCVEICLRPAPSNCYRAAQGSGAYCLSDPSLLRLCQAVTGGDRWRQLTGSPAVVGTQSPGLPFTAFVQLF